MQQVQLYDTTLRDGAQQEGISFSVEDKLKIARKLDDLGIHFIEGGWPGSNPKDVEFFNRAQDLNLSQAVICAFGSTRRPSIKPEQDPNLQALLKAQTTVVTLVGKTWDKHVTHVLETTLEENLQMIADSIDYLKSKGLIVFFDAEHFFDGYKDNPDYALQTLKTADEVGADCIIPCDTNGGSLPHEVASIIEAVRGEIVTLLGIHTHNDGELAVANTLMAVRAGAVHVQGTINGYGERCGNANLCSIIPDLKLKMGVYCVSDENLAKLSEVSHYVSELANLPPMSRQPFVGTSAFAHKGGIHVSGMTKWEKSYHHISPEIVGNRSTVLVSELSGVSNIVHKAKEMGIDLPPKGEETRRILEQVKLMESRGFQYEEAEASFELLVRRTQPDYHPPFELVDFMVIVETGRRHDGMLAEAMIKVKVGEEVIHTASGGNGPVDALDNALLKVLLRFYPDLANVELVDYKVRILDESSGTESQVRVLIESSDGQNEWITVGSSTDIIEASWLALADSLEYWLLKKTNN